VKTGVLLTGATGFVGAELLPRWLRAHPDAVLHCVVRARGADELERRRERTLAWGRVPSGDARRVRFHAGDVTEPDLGLGEDWGRLADDVGEVIHTAASTRFDLDLQASRHSNVTGLENVVAFARRAPGLRRLHHVSTAFVRPDPAGDGSFRNPYEQSKAEAEARLAELGRDLPVSVYRPSIIMGDSRTGRTPHFRVVYEPMKWIYLGKTGLLPCRPTVRLDVVPVDWVCDSIVELAGRPESAGAVYTLCAGPAKAATIGEIIEIALDSGNRRLRELGEPEVPRPQILTPEDIEAAHGDERERLEELWRLASGVMRVYAPYALDEQLFDPSELPPDIADRCPPLRDYWPVLVRYAADTRYEEWAGLDATEAETEP
jgi:thioester reductase-like protein